MFIFIVLFKNRSFVHNYYMFFGLGQLGQLDLKVAWHDFQSPLQKNNFKKGGIFNLAQRRKGAKSH